MTPRPRRDAQEHADLVFRALSDPTRRMLLEVLAHQPAGMPASRLAAHCPDISRPAVSQHLRQLCAAGFVTVSPRGRERIYRISPAGFERAYAVWFGRFEAFWSGKLQDLKRFVEDSEGI